MVSRLLYSGVRLTLGALDDGLEVLASVTELADPHAGAIVVEQSLGSFLQNRRWQGRRARGKIVYLFSCLGHDE